MMVFKGFISDMDGIVANTEYLWYEGTRKFLEQFGIIFSKKGFAKLIGGHLRGDAKMLKEEFKLPLTEQEISINRRKIVLDEMTGKIELNDGYMDLLNLLQKNKIKISLATMSSQEVIDKVLDETGVRNHFDHIVSSFYLKNKAEAYLKAANLMKIETSECFALEDSVSGAIAAKEAGIYCVVIPNGLLSSDTDFLFADEIHSSIREFLSRGTVLSGLVM